MAERCPKALLGVAVSGLSSLAVFYYGVSIDQDLLYHVDTLLAATPAPTITLEEMMPAAIPSVIESYLPDFVTDFIYDLFSGHNWSSCLSIVVLIYAVYSSLKRDYLIACQARWMDILEDGILKKARVFEEQERILKRNCHNKKKDDKQISDLKRELSDSKAKGKEDAGQICDLKEKLEAADTELRAVKLKERQNEISMLQKEITTATTVMDLENQLEAMIAGRDQIGGNQIGEMIDTITELQGDNTQLEAKASGLEHRVTTLEADNVSLRQSTRMAHDAIERHESTIDELRKKDGQQKCTLQRLNETIRTLEIEKTATATAAESASCRSQSIQEREDNLKIQHRRAIESLRASSNAHISSLEDQIAGNKRAMAEQKRTLAEYQGDLKRRNLTIGDLQDRISVLQGQLITANTAHADALSKSESLAKESQRNMATKKTRDTTTQTAIDTLKNETKSKDRQIEALKASSAAAEKHIKTTTSAYDELLKQHVISVGMVAQLGEKIEDFEAALRNAGSGPGCPNQSSPAVIEPAVNGTGPDEVGEEPTPHKPKRNTARSRAHHKAKRQEAKALAEAAASRSSEPQPSDDRFINTNESGGDDKDQESSAEKEGLARMSVCINLGADDRSSAIIKDTWQQPGIGTVHTGGKSPRVALICMYMR